MVGMKKNPTFIGWVFRDFIKLFFGGGRGGGDDDTSQLPYLHSLMTWPHLKERMLVCDKTHALNLSTLCQKGEEGEKEEKEEDRIKQKGKWR